MEKLLCDMFKNWSTHYPQAPALISILPDCDRTHTRFVLLQTYQRFCLLLLLFFCFVFKGHFNIWCFHIRLFWRRRLFPLCLLCVSYLDFVSCSASFCVTMQVFVCLLIEGLLCRCICHWCVGVLMLSWNDKLKTENAQKQLFHCVCCVWTIVRIYLLEAASSLMWSISAPLCLRWVIQWKIWQTVVRSINDRCSSEVLMCGGENFKDPLCQIWWHLVVKKHIAIN